MLAGEVSTWLLVFKMWFKQLEEKHFTAVRQKLASVRMGCHLFLDAVSLIWSASPVSPHLSVCVCSPLIGLEDWFRSPAWWLSGCEWHSVPSLISHSPEYSSPAVNMTQDTSTNIHQHLQLIYLCITQRTISMERHKHRITLLYHILSKTIKTF